MNPTARNGWIDLLRALAATAVVLFHINTIPVPRPPGATADGWHALWGYGHWGVGVFFALSGYCLFPGWSRAAGPGDFLRRRVRRIFPPYWGSLLLVAVLALGVKLVTGVNDVAKLPVDPVAAVATVLLLTTPVTTIPTVNWVYWTLSDIMAFYLLAGLPLLAASRWRFPVLAGLHGLLCLADFLFHPAPGGAWFFVKFWPVFGLGLGLAVWPRHRRAGAAMLVVSLLHAAWLIGTGRDDTHYVAVGAATAGFLAVSRDWGFPAALRPLARLGEFSYSLYLVHVPLGIHLLLRLLPEKFSSGFTYLGSQLLLLGALIAAARLFYLVAERPFLPPARAAA